MSIYSFMTRSAERDVAGSRLRRAPLRGAPDDTSAGDVAGALAARIPSEAIAVYTATLAFLVPKDRALAAQSFAPRWALAGTVAALAVLYAAGTYRRKVIAEGHPFRWPVWRTLNVLVAFSAWVFVIPGSPFQQFSWYTPAIGAIGAIVVNAFLGAIAYFYDEA